MTYTATLDAKAVDPNNGNLLATVTITNGVRTVTRYLAANDLAVTLPGQVLKLVEQLEAQDAALATMQATGTVTFR